MFSCINGTIQVTEGHGYFAQRPRVGQHCVRDKNVLFFFFSQKRLPPCVNNRILYWLCLVCYWSTDSVGGSSVHLTRPLASVNAVKNRQHSLLSTTRPISCQ